MLRFNPIYRKETKTGARTMKIAAILVLFNSILALVSFLMFYGTINGIRGIGVLDYSGLVDLYTTMAYIEFGIVILLVPALTAGSVTGEKERRTLDIMLAGNVRTITVVTGKLMACMQFILITVVSSFPVLSIVFVYGGIRFVNLLEFLAVILVAGFFFGSMGILCSCICKKTTVAVIASYTGLLGFVVLTYGIVYGTGKLGESMAYMKSIQGNVFCIMLINPAATIVELISRQLDTVNGLDRMLFYHAPENSRLMNNWTLYSVAVQAAAGVVFQLLASWVLDPLRFDFFGRLKRAYGKGSRKN